MLIGIILIQAWWIKRALRLNEQAFDSAVYRSLEGVVRQTEQKENFVFINHQLETDSLLKKTKRLLKKRKNQNSYSFKTDNGNNNSNSISVNSESGKEPQTIVRVEKHHNGKKTVQSSVVTGIIVPDSVQMNGLPSVPPQIEIITPEDKQEQVEVIMEKMMSLKDPDSVSVSPKEIQKIITGQLEQNKLPKTFGFALVKKDSGFIFKSVEFKDTLNSYKINLYPNDLFGRSVLLSVNLPGKEAHIRSDVWWVFLLSIFFTITILILFIYSIRMLVRHKKMLEMKNDFINHMSHEFKTPLAGISLGADMLMEKTGQMNSEQIHKVAGTIKKQSLRLSKEVNDVLQNALLEENINRPRALFNIVETIKTQIELFQPQTEVLNAEITTNFSSDKILISGDEIQWQKVFSNLIDNALKFSGENPEIIISVSSAGNKVKIEFSDNGIGIAAKDLPHIFEKFFRSDYYKQSNTQGFGLGLSFVKNIIDAHKGIITAESELNKGTKITIEINAEA
jgi:two-component system phosphate regulon sensor histidine kinase PhoR